MEGSRLLLLARLIKGRGDSRSSGVRKADYDACAVNGEVREVDEGHSA